jgi:hypothetical protein
MFEIKDDKKYLLKNNPLAEKADQLIEGILSKTRRTLERNSIGSQPNRT